MADKKEGLFVQAKDFIQDKAGDLLSGDTTELKKQASETIKKITPDSLDDKVSGAIDTAVDFLKNSFGKK